MSATKYSSRGRTGREGAMLKNLGLLGGLAGLVWTSIVFFVAEKNGALILPICVLAVGALLFWVGMAVAKAAR
jgi:hypothetical protein